MSHIALDREVRGNRQTFLAFSRPSITEAEVDEVVAALRSGWITTGPRVRSFEEAICQLVGAEAALATNSGTAAIHLALTVAGVGPGDAIVTTPMTFASTVHSVVHTGATPVLVDVDPGTGNLDAVRTTEVLDALAAGKWRTLRTGERRTLAGQERLTAILPVHLAGYPCDMTTLMAAAQRHELIVIEDAAHALPASLAGQAVGTTEAPVPRLGCFSFYATKNITTGEGGMLTGPAAMIDQARTWALHGITQDAWNRYGAGGSWFYDVLEPGFKYNMTDIQAALGLAQLRRLESMYARRCQIGETYDRAFDELDALELTHCEPDMVHARHLYTVRLRDGVLRIGRDQVINELTARNIGTSVHFIPVHFHRWYRHHFGYRSGDFPVAEDWYRRSLSLPLHPSLTDEDVADVIYAVHDIVKAHQR